MPFFGDIPLLPEDPILSLPPAFAADPRPLKVNLGIGAYKTAEGVPLVLSSVKKAEIQLLQKNLNKEYLPIEGDKDFINYSLQLIYGNQLLPQIQQKMFSSQTIGGSNALRIAGEFILKNISKNIFLSQPSWQNHTLIFERAGLSVGSYPYFNKNTHRLDFAGMCEAIRNLPQGSVILFHGSCHNPTGIDPTPQQWEEISSLVKQNHLLPLFDLAYQGFGDDFEQDAFSIRHFAKEGHEMIVCYSFSKNFGLYGERVGLLNVITSQPSNLPNIASQIKTLIRGMYSTPSLQGERIIKTIMKSHELTTEWSTELQNMRDRIKEMRTAFAAALLAKGSKQDFSYIHEQKGLFSFSGLNVEQVQRLRQERAIYMPSNGRVNIAGLNTQNLEYVVDSLLTVI